MYNVIASWIYVRLLIYDSRNFRFLSISPQGHYQVIGLVQWGSGGGGVLEYCDDLKSIVEYDTLNEGKTDTCIHSC